MVQTLYHRPSSRAVNQGMQRHLLVLTQVTSLQLHLKVHAAHIDARQPSCWSCEDLRGGCQQRQFNMIDTRSRGRRRRFLAGTRHVLASLLIGLVPLAVGASPLVFICWLMQPTVQAAREISTYDALSATRIEPLPRKMESPNDPSSLAGGNDYAVLSPIQDIAPVQQLQRQERAYDRKQSRSARKTKHGRNYAYAESRDADRRAQSSNGRNGFSNVSAGDWNRDRRSQSRHSPNRAASAYAYADNWGASSKRR